MTDIMERLRRDSKWTEGLTDQQIEEMCNEAADEIERLRAECDDHVTRARTFADGLAVTQMQVERLREALREIADMDNRLDDCLSDATHAARRALEKR